jgi:hypothetical protein
MPHLFSLPSIGDVTMQLPLADPETLFEELLQDLPPETVSMAREFKAFARVRKIKTPAQLLRVVLLYCGVDKALREVAGIGPGHMKVDTCGKRYLHTFLTLKLD